MRKRSFVLFLSSFLVLAGCSAQTNNSASVTTTVYEDTDAEVVKTVTIHADYSSYYDQYGEDWSIGLPNISSNEDVTEMDGNAFVNCSADGNRPSEYTVGLSEGVTDLYIGLPKIEIIENLDEEQKIYIKDGKSQGHDDVDIKSISIIETKDYVQENGGSAYQLQIEIEPAEMIPTSLSYFVDGKGLGPAQRMTSSNYDEVLPYQITYAFDVDSEDESLTKDAYVSFSRMSHFESAEEAVYTSDDVNVHVVE